MLESANKPGKQNSESSRRCNPMHIFEPQIQAQHMCPCTLCAAFHEMLKIVQRLYEYMSFLIPIRPGFFSFVGVPLQNTSKLTCFLHLRLKYRCIIGAKSIDFITVPLVEGLNGVVTLTVNG